MNNNKISEILIDFSDKMTLLSDKNKKYMENIYYDFIEIISDFICDYKKDIGIKLRNNKSNSTHDSIISYIKKIINILKKNEILSYYKLEEISSLLSKMDSLLFIFRFRISDARKSIHLLYNNLNDLEIKRAIKLLILIELKKNNKNSNYLQKWGKEVKDFYKKEYNNYSSLVNKFSKKEFIKFFKDDYGNRNVTKFLKLLDKSNIKIRL
jgi:hypothetical protein